MEILSSFASSFAYHSSDVLNCCERVYLGLEGNRNLHLSPLPMSDKVPPSILEKTREENMSFPNKSLQTYRELQLLTTYSVYHCNYHC